MQHYFYYIISTVILFFFGITPLNAQDAAHMEAGAGQPGLGTTYEFTADTLRASVYCSRRLPELSLPRIGLVLSGGGARGLAQVGVLKALEEAGIRPDLIVGTSIGSIIGGLYASGYRASRLEQTTRTLEWGRILQLGDQTDREALSVDQKSMADRSILTLHLDGLLPVVPTGVSNGQRLMTSLSELVIQGLYHSEDFDSLGISFRAVATDLHSGQRVVLRNGNLAEALRASSSVPVMYAPVARDGMLLVDGGLLSNLPVDVAVEEKCDIIIAVNTVSPLRRAEQLSNVFETLDQSFTVMMSKQIEGMTALADVVIEPELGQHSAGDFSSPGRLIDLGYAAGKDAVATIRELLLEKKLAHHDIDFSNDTTRYHVVIDDMDAEPPNPGELHSLRNAAFKALDMMWTSDVSAVSIRSTTIAETPCLLVRTQALPRFSDIRLNGVTLLDEAVISGIQSRWRGHTMRARNGRELIEYVLEEYRLRGFSLARVREMHIDADGAVTLQIDEGRIHRIRVQGNNRTNDVVIRREMPLREGEVFRISELKRGMTQISALPLFHSVSFDIKNIQDEPELTIRVVERTSQMLQTGILVDDERNAQIGVMLRDASFFGTGTEVRASFFSGAKNRQYTLEYHTNRMFYTPFNVNIQGFYGFRDYNSFRDSKDLPRHRFAREPESVYRAIGYGVQAAVGMYVERFGTLQGRLRYEEQSMRTTEFRMIDAEAVSENHTLVSISVSSTVDTQDRYPFARKGMLFRGDYTSAQTFLGGEIAFSRLTMDYHLFIPIYGDIIVFHPRASFGYGDRTMPRYEEFRIGGLSSFIGMREGEFTGRQIALGGAEFRYRLPVKILFDSYLSLRYNVGRTWEYPELIRLGDLRHGAGLVLGLDTPIGPALFGIGRSFYFVRNNPDIPVRSGPVNVYFSIGVAMD
jgi:NTE family protein